MRKLSTQVTNFSQLSYRYNQTKSYIQTFVMIAQLQLAIYAPDIQNNVKIIQNYFSIVGISAMRRLVAPNGNRLMPT